MRDAVLAPGDLRRIDTHAGPPPECLLRIDTVGTSMELEGAWYAAPDGM
jgi:hypothetical protein